MEPAVCLPDSEPGKNQRRFYCIDRLIDSLVISQKLLILCPLNKYYPSSCLEIHGFYRPKKATICTTVSHSYSSDGSAINSLKQVVQSNV